MNVAKPTLDHSPAKKSKTIITENSSFRISDFSLRDVSWAVAAYIITALFSIGVGVLLESLPEFWRGVLIGGGCALIASALLACYFLLGPATKEIDVASLPELSATVAAKCDDPACSLAETVKAYREETGLGLTEAVAVVRNYKTSKQLGEGTNS
jgi:hypothetical protein